MAVRPSSSLVPVSHGEVIEFMETLNGEAHETLVFRGQQRSNALDYEGIYAEYSEVQKTFLQTANKCLEKLKLPPMEVSDSSGWEGIQASMDAACEILEKVSSRDKDMKGVTGKTKKAFRSLCNKAGAGKAFTQLIPDDMFGSVIGGGLNVILTCLEKTGMHRANVYKTLEKLPRIIEDSLDWVEIADEDANVHKRMAKLYTEICLTLDNILRWFVLNSLVAGAKRLLNPNAMNSDLEERVAEVKVAAKDLKYKGTQVMWGRMKYASDAQELTLASVKRIERMFNRSTVFETIDKIVRENCELILGDGMKQLELRNMKKKSPSLEITAKDILKKLQYDPSLISQDIEALVRLSRPSCIAPINTDRVHAIRRNTRMRAWLTVDEPCLYLLNGGAETSDTSTSFIMAKIAGTLLQQQQRQSRKSHSAMEVIVLAYFCSQHQNYYRDAAASPSELAMSLLLQLIDKYAGFSRAALQDCLDRTDPEDISSICDSLRCLLEELPSEAVVYLVVDGIAYFATPQERMDGMRELMGILVEVFHDNVSATLKFIFSSPARSAFLEDLFEEDEILNIPRDPPPANGPL
ncbi:hypothetical protein PG999_010324 [Apiospora kogelbergensis]|uniref:Nephrocystin 3-like N-terminal domain-containing protein n=1 Tax=Apiospora kogelbergensis TaxID=1337665 RepID=A0AAW0QBC4_9PEZI